MRVLFCGGRDYQNRKAINKIMSRLDLSLVITGGAPGADALADLWAATRGVARVVYPANWECDGKAAGPIRNARMLKEGRPDLVVAFPGGRGTADMIAKAERAGVPVERVNK